LVFRPEEITRNAGVFIPPDCQENFGFDRDYAATLVTAVKSDFGDFSFRLQPLVPTVLQYSLPLSKLIEFPNKFVILSVYQHQLG
jgi:hypothetical protein